jgi:hypothetical protein
MPSNRIGSARARATTSCTVEHGALDARGHEQSRA